ncbi:hypothetical protein Tco_1557121, partial [Tanacetum coccineum]
GIRGEIGVTAFQNALRAQYLPHSSMYVPPPSITTARPWFATTGYNGRDWGKGNSKKELSSSQVEVTDGSNHSVFRCACGLQAPKPSSQSEEVPQGKKPEAKSGLRRKRSLKHTSESTTEASKSQTGQSKKKTKSSSAKDKSPSHPSPPTPVVGEMHKEAQQAAGGPTSLEATSEEGAHPQLISGHDASADFIDEADPGISAPKDSIL